VRWEEHRDPDQPLPVRRWGPAVAIAGLGMTLVAGTTLSAGGPPPSASGHGTVATERSEEPTGRGGLPHSVPAPRTSAVPVPQTVEAPPVVEAAATVPAPVAATPVGRAGQPCDVLGAAGVTEDGVPLVCQGGKGNSAPRWRKA
jgi:hypothetical protein